MKSSIIANYILAFFGLLFKIQFYEIISFLISLSHENKVFIGWQYCFNKVNAKKHSEIADLCQGRAGPF